jgi:DNA-binding NarL/FixJ family response regulator
MMNTDTKKTLEILIIEDDQLTLLGIKSFLQQDPMSFRLNEANTAEKGLALVSTLKPDVVITDMGPHGIDGIEVTRQIKLLSPDTKVIILTSIEVENEILAALSAGADAYCLKSLISNQLPYIIQCVDEGGAWLDPSIARKLVRMIASGQLLSLTSVIQAEVPLLKKAGGKRSLGLTERESLILSMIVEGNNNAEIAQHLHISYHTVKSDVTNILQKLAVDDRVQAAVKALRENLI